MNDRFDSSGKRLARRTSDRFSPSTGGTRASSRRAERDKASPERRYSRSRYERRSFDSASSDAPRAVKIGRAHV